MNRLTRKGFTLVELLVVIAIIVALAALATPAILKQRKKMDMTQAISNSKQVYLEPRADSVHRQFLEPIARSVDRWWLHQIRGDFLRQRRQPRWQ
ncbi:MAG: prepilin-type N-terminal cleavage/methylation domain-containing protein [Verrucomicrobia bacterium]|nr:MAG: prepilin-type N-terminal cleavage/methylation domain-containing protein [Verrucomicrobiota bacterium]